MIPEEIPILSTSVEVSEDYCYHEPIQKKGFQEEEHSKADNMHPATLFEALFPSQEKSEKKYDSTSESE